jgi:hypothetical protein
LKKELNGGVVVGVVVVVVLIVVAIAWKTIGPPAPPGIKTFDKTSLKVMQQKHSAAADEIRKQQQQALQQSQGGSR